MIQLSDQYISNCQNNDLVFVKVTRFHTCPFLPRSTLIDCSLTIEYLPDIMLFESSGSCHNILSQWYNDTARIFFLGLKENRSVLLICLYYCKSSLKNRGKFLNKKSTIYLSVVEAFRIWCRHTVDKIFH